MKQLLDKMKTQNDEFDALINLETHYNALCRVAIVDDDYPEYRHYYEGALEHFLKAVKKNRPEQWEIV